MTLKDRIREVTKDWPRGWQVKLSKHCRVAPSSVADWVSGETKSLEGSNLVRAAEFFKVSAKWLASGKGPMHSAVGEPSNVSEAQTLRQSARVPVQGEVKGGSDGYFEETQYQPTDGQEWVEYWTRDEQAYALRVRGDSMHPRYRAGEFVVVAPTSEPREGGDVVVVCHDGRKMLKQLNWIRDGEVQLLSINNGYGPQTIAMRDILTIQNVAGSVGRDSFAKTKVKDAPTKSYVKQNTVPPWHPSDLPDAKRKRNQ